MVSTTQETLSTREAILAVAVSRFADNGYDGTSLNDIASQVGIRRPSLLHHFPSKDALYGEVFERLLSDWFSRLETAVTSEGRGWPKIELVLTAGFHFFEQNPNYVRLVRREALEGGTHLGIDLAAVLRPMFDKAVTYFAREMGEGVFRPHDPATARADRLRRAAQLLLRRSVPGRPARRRPDGPRALSARLDHITSFFRSALLHE